MNRYWLFFLLGVALPYVVKLGNHLLRANAADHKASVWLALADYMFGDKQAGVTSIMTFGAEWVLGAIYVDKLPMPFTQVLDMPLHVASAFFLGTVSEVIAPLLIKKLVSWFN